jgi:glycosyltransferase involved in cell wall biosynthesis
VRIAIVHSFYRGDSPSGENAAVAAQAEILETQGGHQVATISQHSDRLREARFGVLRAAGRTATGIGRSPSEELAAWRPDLVHIHNLFPNYGSRWLKTWTGPSVLTLHNFRPYCSAATFYRDGKECHDCLRTPVIPAIIHRCYQGSIGGSVPVALSTSPRGPARTPVNRVNEVVVLNEEAARIVTSQSGRVPVIVPNFVASASEKCVDNERKGWIFAGRLSAEKGILELLREWPRGEELCIFGDGPLRVEVLAMAGERAGVHYRGSVTPGQLRSALRESEGLVLPSLWREGLPTVALESLAEGAPVVASAWVASGMLFESLGVGKVYLPGSGELSAALSTVRAKGPESRARAYEVQQDMFSAESWLRKISTVYATAVSGI